MLQATIDIDSPDSDSDSDSDIRFAPVQEIKKFSQEIC